MARHNCTVVLNDSTYKQKIFSLLESGVYEPLKKDSTSQIERNIRRLLSKHKSILSTDLKRKLTPYHSKPLHLYGLPKIHKPDIPLRPIVSSNGSPCYALAGFLHKILAPLVSNTDSFVKNSEHFIQLLKDINLRNGDILVSFDVVSLFTNVPVEEVLRVIKNKLCMDSTVSDRSPLQVDDVMELLEVCMKTTYFQFEDKFYQQNDGMAMGSSLSPVVSNIFMEHFEKLAIDTTDLRPAVWLRYVEDTFVVWPHGSTRLQEFLHHLNSLRPTIQFTMEVKTNNTLPFLDVLVTKRGLNLSTKVYRKPTHTGRYLNFKSDHLQHVKKRSCLQSG
jgi:hypothetical protein